MRERLENKMSDIARKSSRLFGLMQDGHVDPDVAGLPLNALATKNWQLTSELALRPNNAAPATRTADGAAYRALVGELISHLLEAQDLEVDIVPASQVMRGTLRRITVLPPEDGARQALEIETRPWINAQPAEQY